MKFINQVLLVLSIISLFGCSKNKLNQDPLGLLDEKQMTNREGVERLLIGAYSLLDGIGGNNTGWGSSASNWIYGSICGSEAYTGSASWDQADIRSIEQFGHSASNQYLLDKWAAVYGGIQRCNDVLRVMKKSSDISEFDQIRIAAEARFLRGHYHFEAFKMWGRIPVVDETVGYEFEKYLLSNARNSYSFIEADLKYATENLSESSFQGAVGRGNKYSAMSLLAKLYMYKQQFSKASSLFDLIIASGKYKLVKYHDNFRASSKNNQESVFVVQMSVHDGAMGNNGNMGEVLNYPFDGSTGACCGFFQPSQWLVNHFKTDSTTGLPDLDNYNFIDLKHDMGLQSADPFIPYAGTLDPRLDWTVGRRGIPYLDWGNHPGMNWIRDQGYSGPYSPKKNVYYKSEMGDLTESLSWGPMATAININLIRYSDILLMAAEAEIESGNFEKARYLVNQVRSRAADSSGWVVTMEGKPAANYRIGIYTVPWDNIDLARKAVRYERVLELAMEGHRFFDIGRWQMADVEINQYLQKEKLLRTYLSGSTFIKGRNEVFPIPQSEIDKSVTADGVAQLVQNPGY